MTEPQPIVIAGAGPVGATAALILARAGLRVILLEAEAALAEDLRGSTFHPPTLDMLDDLGVTEQLLPQGLVVPKYQYRDRRSGAYAEFDLGLLKGESRHPFRLQCEQFKLTRTILPMLEESGLVDVRFSSRLRTVENRPGGVALSIDGPAGPETIAGRFLIGCDGGRSRTRKHMDIAFEGFTFPERFLVVSTDFPFEQYLPGLSDVSYLADPAEWCVLLRVPGLWRAMFPTAPEASDAALTAPEAVAARLAGLVPEAATAKAAHVTLYRVHQRVAERYRVGNVLLAGDAAHLNNPLGGMGMNGGLHDVFNLSAKLISILKDGAGEELLELYERQRREITIRFIQSQSLQNKQNIARQEAAARLAHITELQEIAGDEAQAIAFLRRNNMLDALDEADAIT